MLAPAVATPKPPRRAQPSPRAEPDDPLRAAIAALEAVDRDLLVVLALVVKPVTRTDWTELAKRGGITQPGGNAFDTKALEPRCVRLADAGLVVVHRPTPHQILYGVPPEIAMPVLIQARAEDRLARFLGDRSPRRGAWFDPWMTGADLRLAAVMGDLELARRALGFAHLDPASVALHIITALGRTPEIDWFAVLPSDAHRMAYVAAIVQLGIATLTRVPEPLLALALAFGDRSLNLEVARLLALGGQAERAAAIEPLPKYGAEGLAVISAFHAGDWARTAALGHAAIATMKGRKRPTLPDVEGVCHLFATLVAAAGDPLGLSALRARLEAVAQSGRALPGPYRVAGVLHDTFAGAEPPEYAKCTPEDRARGWDEALANCLHDRWLEPTHSVHAARSDRAEIEALVHANASHWRAHAEAGGFAAHAREFAAILAAEAPAKSIAAAFRRRPAWEAALASLETLAGASVAEDAGATAAPRELVWELAVLGHRVFVTPRIRAGVRAKKGQSVPLSRLQGGDDEGLLTDADRRVIAGAQPDRWRRAGGHAFELDDAAALALVGHPRVVGPDGLAIAVERGPAKIRTSRVGEGTEVRLSPAALRDHALVVVQATPARVVLYERTPELTRLAELLARVGTLAVPDEGRDRLAQALSRLTATASIEVEGDLPIAGATDVAADSTPVLQLAWDGTMLTVRAAVAPLGPDGPHVRPGVGATVLVADVAGAGMRRTTRDLALERRRCEAVQDACPTLGGFGDGELHWGTTSVADALAILLELDAQGDAVRLEWAEGQRLELPRRVDLEHLKLRVGKGPKWFELDVSLQIDEHAVLQFRDLLRAREGTRFVALPRGRFLALSDELRARLDGLEAIGEAHGKTLAVASALLPMVEDLAADVPGASFDDATRQRLARLREIQTLEPRMPRGFAATLRPYQRDGFVWLARLGEAGLGACLADDMGLGKTVQALALLAHRAKQGPALVVCPTSVVLNWVAEAARFAPTLRIVPLATAEDRAAAVRDAGPRDVVVCSYTLLGAEIETLAAARFATAVFDEAHALKNPRTQRATAARRIDADFRLGLTGTPLENHLGELWSLFATLVPGLLGAQTDFDRRFAAPIAAGARESANRLRALLRPFMLRRLKSAVLDELPARTEITLRIAPNPEQRAFYEAVRRRAVEHMAALDQKKKRLGVLAEITKLRQAAIDPRVLDAAAPKGAKLDVLFERLGELRAEGHRALVFTQFLGSLAAVRERLVADGYEFFELDGSTPAAVRAKRIDAFQAGEADVFLLSLRAGGQGVNLTGADYVFHLDPWWNPAVEDQATDRAHRIGQSRPVTVYRLVTEGTIEEKILALHGTKREMAEDLLTGMERGEGLDFEQLMGLLDG